MQEQERELLERVWRFAMPEGAVDIRTRACRLKSMSFPSNHCSAPNGSQRPSRPRLVGKSLVDTRWSAAFGEYCTFDRLRVPTTAEVAWHLPEGPFTYWRGRVTEFRVLR